MRRYLLFLLALPLCAAPLITVSASSMDILGSNQRISITVDLVDPNNTGLLRVNGTNVIPIMTASSGAPGTTATVGPIYGNDVIKDGFGNLNSTYYRVRVFTVPGLAPVNIISSTAAFQQFFAFTGAGTIDLATATPLAPSFMTGTNGSVVTPQLNGCQHVNAIQTFAQALAVGGVTCIQVDAGTYTVNTNATIPANVALVSTSTGILSVANAVTLTINGPINAGPQQLFSYTGSGVVALGGLANPVNCLWFPGSDIGAQCNAAYTALPATGGEIWLTPQPSASCYNFSTPILFATAGKYVIFNGRAPGSSNNANPGNSCLNYTPTTATDAITADWTAPTGGGIKSGAGINYITLVNNGCNTIGGCGSSARGIRFSTNNGGAENGLFQGLTVQGFGTGLFDNNSNGTSYGMNFVNLSLDYNTTGLNLQGYESLHFMNAYVQFNGTGATVASGQTIFVGGAIESNTTVGFTSSAPSGLTIAQFVGVHFENLGNYTAHFISGAMNLVMEGGLMLDDFTAGANLDYMISLTGGHVKIDGVLVSTSRTAGVAAILLANGPLRGITNFMVNSPSLITARVGGSAHFSISDFSTTPTIFAPYSWNVEACLSIGGTTGSSAAPTLLCSTNTGGVANSLNLGFANTSGTIGTIVCTTSQKTETAADTNVLTCPIPAQAGSYRVRFVLSTSAANAATLGWTILYTDSNGTSNGPTNMSLFQTGVAAPQSTWVVNSTADFYGSADIDVNNAGTSIVVKLTFTGTSFTAKVSATVERII